MTQETHPPPQESLPVTETLSPSKETESISLPPTDFLSKLDYQYSDEEKKKYTNIYSSTLKKININEILKAKVVSVTQKEVVLSIGFKSDGSVPVAEFKDLPVLKVGDEVEVFVESLEDKGGQIILSRKRAKLIRMWETINDALQNDKIIEGIVKRRTKGGLVVDLMGIEAFLPGSQIDVKPIRDYDVYVGKKMEFKVVKINHMQRNVVVSHKALIEKDLEAQKVEMMKKIQKGQVLEGIVKNITDFGVFVDLGGVDGLIHITDLVWGRISHPKEIVTLDQKIRVVVTDFDEDKKRISLGLKQLQPHPWEALGEDVQIGSKVKGRIVTLADYGAFLEILTGVEGLIHVSEMSWSQHPPDPQARFKTGEELAVVILTLDRQERKMSLSLKRMQPDPWEKVPDKYSIGSKHKASVRNLANYGVFVEIEEGIEGMVHISELSWTKKIKHPSDYLKKDDIVDVIVLGIDNENRRLNLGHKELIENPWDIFEREFPLSALISGTVQKISGKGAILDLSYGLEGFVPKKYLPQEPVINSGDSLELMLIEFDKGAKRIILAEKSFEGKVEIKSKQSSAPEETPIASISSAEELKHGIGDGVTSTDPEEDKVEDTAEETPEKVKKAKKKPENENSKKEKTSVKKKAEKAKK